MTTKKDLPRTPLALAVMNLLMEHPMHPYEMKSKMKERGHDQVVKIAGGSIYDTVERLEEGGFIAVQETSRDGRRPEKTTYAITDHGREEILAWLREMLAQPVNDYPQFAAALAFFAALDKDEVTHLLKARTALLESEIAGMKKGLEGWMGEMGIPRLFLIESEYAIAMKTAEVNWVRDLIRDIDALWMTADQMRAAETAIQSRGGGGVSE
ncbi:MAG: PadR family transcriptional regulator [Chloroflexi bacterium]|nr:MAG: PadR family transcriptional regulator [Chloroflexota bacterium]